MHGARQAVGTEAERRGGGKQAGVVLKKEKPQPKFLVIKQHKMRFAQNWNQKIYSIMSHKCGMSRLQGCMSY